jgi:hypothetical protein
MIFVVSGTIGYAAAHIYAYYKYSKRPEEYQEFTNGMMAVEDIEELSTYISETTGQKALGVVAHQNLPDMFKTHEEKQQIENLEFIKRFFAHFDNQNNSDAIVQNNFMQPPMVGIKESDGNIKNPTSIYIQDKTRVTNHRRVMYRQRNNFTKALVAQVKLSIDWRTRDPANEKVARKMIKDAMAEHGLSITDSVRTLPIAIEAVFLPNDAEIYANDWRHSRAARNRIARYYAPEDYNGNLSFMRWIWNNCSGYQNSMQDGGRLNTMDQSFDTPLGLRPDAARQHTTVVRPPYVD